MAAIYAIMGACVPMGLPPSLAPVPRATKGPPVSKVSTKVRVGRSGHEIYSSMPNETAMCLVSERVSRVSPHAVCVM